MNEFFVGTFFRFLFSFVFIPWRQKKKIFFSFKFLTVIFYVHPEQTNLKDKKFWDVLYSSVCVLYICFSVSFFFLAFVSEFRYVCFPRIFFFFFVFFFLLGVVGFRQISFREGEPQKKIFFCWQNPEKVFAPPPKKNSSYFISTFLLITDLMSSVAVPLSLSEWLQTGFEESKVDDDDDVAVPASSDLPPFPVYYHQRFSSFVSRSSPRTLLAAMENVFREDDSVNFAVSFKKNKIKGVILSDQRTDFKVRLYKGQRSDEVLCEFQRLSGCVVTFNEMYRRTLKGILEHVSGGLDGHGPPVPSPWLAKSEWFEKKAGEQHEVQLDPETAANLIAMADSENFLLRLQGAEALASITSEKRNMVNVNFFLFCFCFFNGYHFFFFLIFCNVSLCMYLCCEVSGVDHICFLFIFFRFN